MDLFRKLLLAIVFISLSNLVMASTCANQADLNSCTGRDFKNVDAELNTLYKKILTEYADNPDFIKRFKEAQRAWVKFRDAEMAALFIPGKDYGSVQPMCHATWMETLTQQRIAQLKKWADKTEEGDTCSGTIKFK